MHNGRIHLYTGDGKGKTTAAVGLAVRALGAGKTVLFAQFMKGRDTAERKVLESLGATLVRASDSEKFVFNMSDVEKAAYMKDQERIFKDVLLRSSLHDVIILDEIVGCLNTGMIDAKDVYRFLDREKPEHEIVLTGRDANEKLRERADYLSEIHAVRHPYSQGVGPRAGIEY